MTPISSKVASNCLIFERYNETSAPVCLAAGKTMKMKPRTAINNTTVDHGFIQGNFSLKHSKCNLGCELVPSGEILRARMLRRLLKLNYVIELQIPYFVYQWSHRLLPPCFSEYFKFTSSVYSYSTGQSCNRNLYVTSVNTTQYGVRSLKFTGPRLWNSLPTSITNSKSLRIFRKTLKNSVFNCYSI